MNANIFFKEWKRYRHSLVLWSMVLSLFIVLTMVFYPAIAENAAQIESLLQSPMMRSMMEMFGGGDTSSFTDLLGFYATKNISNILLLGSIFSIILASSIVAREENEKTIEFLLTRPVTRSEIFLTKAVVWLSIILVLNLITTAIGLTMLEIFKNDAPKKFNLTQETKENLVQGLKNNPSGIKTVFNPDDKTFDEVMIRRMSDQMKTEQAEIEKQGINSETLEELTAELSQGPEQLLHKVKKDPDKYMKMFNIPVQDREKFLSEVEETEKNYSSLREGYKNNPQTFIGFFEQDPEYFMQKFTNDTEHLEKAIREFGWDRGMISNAYSAYDRKNFFILSLYSFLLMIAFGGIGLFISILIKRGRPITNAGVGLVLAAFVLDGASKLSDKLDFIGYLTPFKYVNVSVLEPGYGFEAWRLAYLIGVPFILTIISLMIYQKKDIII